MSLDQYLPVFLFVLVGIGVGVAPQVLGYILGPNRPDPAKNSPYECGFEAFGDARMKFDVRYYLVAILFILFDLEIAFLFPWAVALKDIGLSLIHISEPTRQAEISYAVFCLKKKKS